MNFFLIFTLSESNHFFASLKMFQSLTQEQGDSPPVGIHNPFIILPHIPSPCLSFECLFIIIPYFLPTRVIIPCLHQLSSINLPSSHNSSSPNLKNHQIHHKNKYSHPNQAPKQTSSSSSNHATPNTNLIPLPHLFPTFLRHA